MPKFGIQIRNFPGRNETSMAYSFCELIAKRAEALNFDSIWMVDHLEMAPPIANEVQQNPDAWVTIAGIACNTSRIRIGTLVSCNIFRNPGLLAKMAATLDELSKGRLNFGIGA